MVRPILEQEIRAREVEPGAFILSPPAYDVLRAELSELLDMPAEELRPIRYRDIPIMVDKAQREPVTVSEYEGPERLEESPAGPAFPTHYMIIEQISDEEDGDGNPFSAAESLESWINWIRNLGRDEPDT